MSITNPCEYAKQFRTELIADLQMNEKYTCPKCCIKYVDGDYEGNCHYERIESQSDDEDDEVLTAEVLAKKYELVCAFDYYNTSMAEVIKEWAEQVLKECFEIGGEELKAKWAKKFGDV